MPKINCSEETLVSLINDTISSCVSDNLVQMLENDPEEWRFEYALIFRNMYMTLIDYPTITTGFVEQKFSKPVILIKTNADNVDNIIHIISIGHIKDVFTTLPNFQVNALAEPFSMNLNSFGANNGRDKSKPLDVCFRTKDSSAYDRKALSVGLSKKLLRLYSLADSAAYYFQYYQTQKEPYSGKYVPIPKTFHLPELITSYPDSKIERFLGVRCNQATTVQFLTNPLKRPNPNVGGVAKCNDSDDSDTSETDTDED